MCVCGGRGLPQPGQDGGVGTQPSPDRGVPQPGQDGGYHSQGWGTPPIQGWGIPPVQRWGTSSSRDGVPPPIPHPEMGTPSSVGQQVEYLIRGGRYASCIHAGGHSCLNNVNYFFSIHFELTPIELVY